MLPGGNPDPGESLKVALKRELAEELGVQVAVEDMILVGEVLHFNQKEDTLHCLFRVTIEKGNLVWILPIPLLSRLNGCFGNSCPK